MEKRYQHTVNGQSVLEDDLNVMGEASALADDRVLAELFRMAPYDGVTVSRGVLPYGYSTGGNTALVTPNGASGSVLVNPFRAFIGSRTAVGTDGKLNWRDIRSTIGVGATTLGQSVALGANASGSPRWDLVYAAVSVDASGPSVTRKVKDPTSKVIAGVSLVTTLVTTVALGVVAGTPAGSPTFPALPSDAGGTYYVPLAYVRVIDGFGGGSTLNNKDVNDVAPVLVLSRLMGGGTMRPANQQNVVGGAAISSTGTSTQNGALAWSGTTNTRPAAYVPPTMIGCETLIVAIDVGNASSLNWSHQNGSVVDDSRDWRQRLFRWSAGVGQGGANGGLFPWSPGIAGTGVLNAAATAAHQSPPPGNTISATQATHAVGMGCTALGGTVNAAACVAANGGASSAPTVNSNIATNVMAANTAVYLYADVTTGALKVGIVGSPLVSIVFWLDASAPFPNP